MNAYKLEFDANRYRGIGPLNSADLDSDLLWLNGESKSKSWNPPELAYSIPESSEDSITDVSWLGPGLFAFSKKATEALGGLLEAAGELLPIEVEGDKLMVFNPLNVQNCLDTATSQYNNRRNGNIGRLLKPSIDLSKIDEKALFLTPETQRNMLFATDEFKQAYEAAGLTGLIFIDCTKPAQSPPVAASLLPV